MDNKTLLLIGAAVAVVFLPQIVAFAKGFLEKAKSAAPAPSSSSVTSRPVGSEPADWINDLYSLNKVLIANGQKEAADLLSQAMVKIIGAPSGGAKK